MRSLVPISLGLLLLSAAGLKGYELFVAPLPETDVWTSRVFRIGVIETECFLGGWLLSGIWPLGARRAALAAFITFFAVSLTKALAGEGNCDCFGRVLFTIDPRWTAALDLAAILALWRWRAGEPEGAPLGALWLRAAVLLLLLVLVGVPGGIVLAVSQSAVLDSDGEIGANSSTVVLEPEKWIGRRCPLLPYIDIGDELSQDRWLVVLYHHDCSRCREVVPAYENRALAAASDPAAPSIAFVAVPPHGAPLWQFALHSPSRQGRLTASKEWFVKTPAVLRLQDGVVQPESTLPGGSE